MKTVLQEADELIPRPDPPSWRDQRQKLEALFDTLQDGISTSSETGKDWFRMLSSLQSLAVTTIDFKTEFSSELHGPLPNIAAAQQGIQEIVNICQRIKPVIIGMDRIEIADR